MNCVVKSAEKLCDAVVWFIEIGLGKVGLLAKQSFNRRFMCASVVRLL